jgi:peptide/nickel transport system permease protein
LAVGALLISLLIGVPLGVVSAVRENTPLDHVARIASLFSLSIPIFWQAAMMILALSLWFRWVPPVEYSPLTRAPAANLQQMILPAIVLGTVVAAQVMRMTRSSLLDVLRHDHVRTARAKGLTERLVVSRHAFRNAMIPIITVIALGIPRMVGGAAITESVFAWPGMGQLAVDSALQRDYPTIMGITMMVSIVVIVTNFLTDLSYLLIDPRVKLNRG